MINTTGDPQCCKRPDIKVMDTWTGTKPGQGDRLVNRICLNCKEHWHGSNDDVTRYTRREWDAWLEEVTE